jgi:hypothetical protein
MDEPEALILESKEKDSTDEHGNFFLEKPQEPCSHSAPLEFDTLCAMSMYEDHNHPKILNCKMFRRLVVDAFVYHKFCKSRGCIFGTNLAAEASTLNQQLAVKLGTTSPMIAARGCSHGRACDHKQRTVGR